ncbi:MAG: phospho-N-acetylmuramoyl-pentapeptide-transferase [Chloroflexi bacterium]|jgi:phospho-N-acetylmuramoyl-pentapeptide-transferase|nr:MAG: phospho-N-acetylmuramoyl-pentapeptide-transferase [Chloroflexota bacterium]
MIAIVQALVLAFACVAFVMPAYLRLLKYSGFGKRIRRDYGLDHHIVKEGTPTMGGLLLVAVVISLALLLDAVDASTYAILLALLGVGLLGAFDDWLNARTGDGISPRMKITWQLAVSVISAIYLQQHFAFSSVVVPFVGEVSIGVVPWIVLAVTAIISTSNGVNLTDGLDGLAGGTMVFAWLSYMVVALLNAPGQFNVAIVCSLIAGVLVGFLWFNIHPAAIIMGDAGALGFGAALAVTGLVTGHVLLLPFIGVIFVVETGSVIVQNISKRLLGRRIFTQTPIHHHFEKMGWAETQITFRFWVVGAIGGVIGVVIFLATRGQV